MKKKVFAVVLTIVLAFSMTACGGTKKAETKEDTKKTETKEDAKKTETEEDAKKTETEEDTKETETQVDGEEQEVAETSEEALNEYGVTDEEMQLYVDKLKGKIEEKKAIYQKIENMEGNPEAEGDSFDNMIWFDPIIPSLLGVGVDCKDMYSTDEILEPCLKEDSSTMWSVYCKATKEWKEEENISEEKCKKFLETTFENWETFRDTYLVQAYNEVVKE